MKEKATTILVNASEVITCIPAQPGGEENPVGRIPDGAVAIAGETILAVGTTEEVLGSVDQAEAKIIDVSGKVLAPGFVDSHTHVVFGGSRVDEYSARMGGLSKDKIESLGIPTGIVASMNMTRAATKTELTDSAAARILQMLRAGTTTVESKSGYGLNLDAELKMLKVNQHLKQRLPVDIVSTFLGAHAFPPEISQEEYIEMVVHEMVPRVAAEGLAEFCDIYIDEGYFTLAQGRHILEAAKAAGLGLKIHADQYSALGASDLAAELGAVSADHLNYTTRETMVKLAQAGVVGVLMPVIDFAVQHPKPFDARAMMDAGMTLALATDMCPGGWTESMQFVMQFACRAHGFSPAEAILAATWGGALALGLRDRGRLAPGMLADIQVWSVSQYEDVIYRLGSNLVEKVIRRGALVINEPPTRPR